VYYTDVWTTRRLMEGADSLLLSSLQRRSIVCLFAQMPKDQV